MSYALGKQGGTRKKLERSSGAGSLRLTGALSVGLPKVLPQFMAMVSLKNVDQPLEFEVQLVQFQAIRRLVDEEHRRPKSERNGTHEIKAKKQQRAELKAKRTWEEASLQK